MIPETCKEITDTLRDALAVFMFYVFLFIWFASFLCWLPIRFVYVCTTGFVKTLKNIADEIDPWSPDKKGES